MTEIQKTELYIHALKGLLELHPKDECLGECMQSQALLYSIQLCKANESAVMPEKRKVSEPEEDYLLKHIPNPRNLGFNEALNLCRAVVVKGEMRIKELESRLEYYPFKEKK